jgi:hypothetical protein
MFNLRNKISLPQRYNNYEIQDNDVEEEMFEINDPYPYNIENRMLLTDRKLPPLHKKYWRPYFSPKFNSWEMDFMIVPLRYNNPFINRHQIETTSQFNYLFVININTKYLCVYPCHIKDEASVIHALSDMINHRGIEINNIRGDYDTAFGNNVREWLNNHRISSYFTSSPYINRNRIVDRVMRTIRDKFDQLGLRAHLYDVHLMERIVEKYNDTPHRAYDHKFTPYEAQTDSQIERVFIWDKQRQLEKINFSKFRYEPNDLLLVHIPFKDINYKRRRNFTHLARFIRYNHGNVICHPFHPTDEEWIELPIYYTKLASRENYADYFYN